jgi:hypothetical protein
MGILLCLAQSKAYADTINIFTSIAAWQAAVVGSPQFSETFSNFTQDTYFQTGPLNVGPFSLEQIGQNPFGDLGNLIDVPPLQFTDNSGVTNAAMYTKYGVSIDLMSFSGPVFAWGANFYGAESSELENLILTAAGGGVVGTVPVTVDTGFFGFVISPSDGLSSITFESQIDNPDPTIGQGFGLENVVGAYTAVTTPEPSSILLLGAGLILMAAIYRRRKTTPIHKGL